MNFILYYMIYGKVGQRGQVVIPKKIREEKNIHPGDTVQFHLEGENVVIKKLELTDGLTIIDILKHVNFEDNLVKQLRNEWE